MRLNPAGWERKTLPDIVRPGLDVIFVGINPGKRSAQIGHHFGGTNNHFWRLLYESGWTPRLFAPEEDALLLELGIGLTNLAPRATRSASDLAKGEMEAGGEALRAKMSVWRPRIACFLGKDPYAYYAGIAPARVRWGRQSGAHVAGVMEFVAPNPSGRSTIPYEERLRAFKAVRAIARGARSEAVELGQDEEGSVSTR